MTYNIVAAGLEGRDHHLNLSAKYIRQTRGFVHTMVLSARRKAEDKVMILSSATPLVFANTKQKTRMNQPIFLYSVGSARWNSGWKIKNEAAGLLQLIPLVLQTQTGQSERQRMNQPVFCNSLGPANTKYNIPVIRRWHDKEIKYPCCIRSGTMKLLVYYQVLGGKRSGRLPTNFSLQIHKLSILLYSSQFKRLLTYSLLIHFKMIICTDQSMKLHGQLFSKPGNYLHFSLFREVKIHTFKDQT